MVRSFSSNRFLETTHLVSSKQLYHVGKRKKFLFWMVHIPKECHNGQRADMKNVIYTTEIKGPKSPFTFLPLHSGDHLVKTKCKKRSKCTVLFFVFSSRINIFVWTRFCKRVFENILFVCVCAHTLG